MQGMDGSGESSDNYRRPPGRGTPLELPLTYRTGKFWQPDVTVACVVVRDGQLLMVEETVQGQLVLNQPAGHLEPDESLFAAALRETLEETGWHVQLTAFIGAYQWTAPDAAAGGSGRHYLRMAFAADPLRHEPTRTLDEGIVRALWLDPEQLQAEAGRHRSPLVWQVVEDFLGGRRYPLACLNQLP
jgi:8-oxo-dGTP pyrophosphatase MutT (NUDIX family)